MKQSDINITYQLSPQNLENFFNIYQDDNGFYYYNITKTINFPDDLSPDTYDEYIVENKDMWPNIAFKFYKSVKLWWLVCAANNIQDPLLPPTPGLLLKIIKSSIVANILTQIKSST